MKDKKICQACHGDGKEKYSCCGDELEGSLFEDAGLCPTCKEHTGGECGECDGSGIEKTKFRVNVKIAGIDAGNQIYIIAETSQEAEKAVRTHYQNRGKQIEQIYNIEKN